MMILVTEPNEQLIVQKILFSLGYGWINSNDEVIYYDFEKFVCYIADEKEKYIMYITDLDLEYYIINYNNGFDPIPANIYIREEKLKRILYENI